MPGIEAGQLRRWFTRGYRPGHLFLVLDKRYPAQNSIWNILDEGRVDWDFETNLESDSFEVDDDD
jgi:hypothetical protein